MTDIPGNASGQFVVGEFEFLSTTGELRSRTDAENVKRLPPQPARLLALLIDNKGQVVSRQKIKEEVWGDVPVDLAQSLHFCIRQVRSALGDSASSPTYVETIPRRGYRLIANCEQTASQGSTENVAEKPIVAPSMIKGTTTKKTSAAWAVFMSCLVIGMVSLAWLLEIPPFQQNSTVIGPHKTVRIAIMPFSRLPDETLNDKNKPIAELLVLDLVKNGPENFEVIGPTTTEAFQASAESLQALIDEYSVDFVINSRFVTDSDKPGFLAELIRASDGAHIWVQLFDKTTPNREVVRTILKNVCPKLTHANHDSRR